MNSKNINMNNINMNKISKYTFNFIRLFYKQKRYKTTKEVFLNTKKKSKPIILYNLDNTIFGEYPSIVEAAKIVDCSPRTISRVLRTNKKILRKRFIVKYISSKKIFYNDGSWFKTKLVKVSGCYRWLSIKVFKLIFSYVIILLLLILSTLGYVYYIYEFDNVIDIILSNTDTSSDKSFKLQDNSLYEDDKLLKLQDNNLDEGNRYISCVNNTEENENSFIKEMINKFIKLFKNDESIDYKDIHYDSKFNSYAKDLKYFVDPYTIIKE